MVVNCVFIDSLDVLVFILFFACQLHGQCLAFADNPTALLDLKQCYLPFRVRVPITL